MRRLFAAVILGGTLEASGVAVSATPACRVAGENVGFGPDSDFDDEVVIRPPGETPFRLTLASADQVLVSVPVRAGAPTPIEVHDVISFSGTTGPLSYRVSRPLETSQGMVKLFVGATLVRAAADADGVVGAIELRESTETLESVRVPCDALTLKVRIESSDEKLITGDGTWWRAKGGPGRFVLRAQPNDRAPRVVLADHGPRGEADVLAFERLGVRGGWVHVAREGFRAVALGWVPTETLERLAIAPARTGCCYGSTAAAGFSGHRHGAKRHLYEGPAHIAVGTTIFADKGTSPWAKVEKDAVFGVRFDAEDGWAEITRIPDVVSQEQPAFVRVAAIKNGR